MSKPYTRIEYRIVGPNSVTQRTSKGIPKQQSRSWWRELLITSYLRYAKFGKEHTLQRRLVAYSDWEDLETV